MGATLSTTVSLSAVLVVLNEVNEVNADCYLHYLRGSNNRLNEASANRNNANRLFDSQNNNRGGYNCCDLDVEEGFNANDWMADASEMYDFRRLYEDSNGNDAGATLEKQYEEIYFVGSEISLTWTNQHGTGNKKLLSEMILQFGCDMVPRAESAQTQGFGPSGNIDNIDYDGCDNDCKDRLALMRSLGLRMELMNGGNTNTPDDPNGANDIQATYTGNNNANEGRHESEEWYHLCESRSRQKGLFHADQNPQGESQIYTRQNPGGTRRGLECPEERDYYPWWNPSPWHDIAIITPSMERCQNHMAPNSQNVQLKCTCNREDYASSDAPQNYLPADEYIDLNLNQTLCEAQEGAEWKCFGFAADEPECVDSYWTKVNYLGNADGTTRGGKQAHYDWTLPSYASLKDEHYCYPYDYTVDGVNGVGMTNTDTDISCFRMVFRIRYNMSTMDYDPFKTNSTHDYDPNNGILSPIENNPEVDVGFYVQGLQLAINTAQTGRTFQDRSHTFLVCDRPGNSAWENKDQLINVNVRGKRGNIVQTFPATEYDFEPQHVEVAPNTDVCYHFQWCGSNTHNNGAPGGDGQTGDDGEGRGGSDRSNLAQMADMDQSYPVPYDTMMADGEAVDDWFDYVDCYHPLQPGSAALSKADAQLVLGTAGFYKGVDYMIDFCADVDDDENGENRGECIVDELLNNVSASFRAGLICCLKDNIDSNTEKSFAFLSTRNNNFSNRSQKWKFVITASPDDKSLW